MASWDRRRMASSAPRNDRLRATPPLQTSNLDSSRNTRYSWMETPVEMQRSTFQPYRQFSSLEDSIIDESPISPASPSRGLPSYQQDAQGEVTNIPTEKAAQVQSPQEVHPAYYAPFREDSQRQQSRNTPALEEAQSPGPVPLKSEIRPVQSTTTPISTIFDGPPNAVAESREGIGYRETYNPNSLQGPNVGSENHRPGQVSHPNSAVNPHWKNGLCEPDAICCMGSFLPCMVCGKTSYRLSRKTQRQDPTDFLGYESCNDSCGIMAAACGFQWIFAAIHRTRIRKLYHLEGSLGNDCFKSLCCCCCVIMQNEREVRDREELIRKHAGPSIGAYVAPQAMTYAPPPG